MTSINNIRRRLGQLLVIGFEGTEVTDAVWNLLAQVRPAGVILFARNLVDPEQTRRLNTDLQAAAHQLGIAPLLIGIDHEGGAVVRMGPPVVAFPGNMALAATGSPELAYLQAQAMAEELLALGFNWNFAPCVDVNSNPQNPIIGVRSFGDQPARVAEFGIAAIKGFQSRGLAACAKHFPGHGDTAEDSHLGLPCVARSLEELRQVELVPFQAAVRAGVASLMTAHILFPALEPDRPATVSHLIVTGLLREEMGFRGVIVSDALEMAGLADSVGVARGAVQSITAGVDLLLACNSASVREEAFAALHQAFDRGCLSPLLVNLALERVDCMKQHFLCQLPEPPPLSVVGCPEHRKLEAQIAAESIALVRNEPGVLPLSGQRVRLLCVGVTEDALTLLRELLGKGCAVVDPPEQAQAVLLVTRDLHRRPGEVARLRQAVLDEPKAALLAVGYPGDLSLLPEATTAIATCSAAPASLEAAVAVLLGAAAAPGRIPVGL